MNRIISRIFMISAIILPLGLYFAFSYPYFLGPDKDTIEEIESKFFLNNTTKVFTEQLKFRDKAILEYKKNLNAIISNPALDSIFNKNAISSKIVNRYLLPKTETFFAISLNNYVTKPSFLVKFDTFYVKFSIDEEKINAIIEHQNITPFDFEKVLRDQDYIKVERKAANHLSVLGSLIFVGALICLYFLIIFTEAQEERGDESEKPLTKSSIEITVKRLDHLMSKAEDEVDTKSEDEASSVNAEEYIKKLGELRNNVKHLELRNKSSFIIENIVRKAETKMKEVHSRSNLMLVAGLTMAFLGVSFFYYTLPNVTNSNTDIVKILALSVRPTLILLFIESISWYLLKQHKNLLADYKYYHLIYNKKMNYLVSHKLISEEDFEKNSISKIIPLMLLTEEHTNLFKERAKDDSTEEDSNIVFKTLLDKLMSKI